MIDNTTGLPYLKNHLDAHSITCILEECSDGFTELTFTSPQLEGLVLIFNPDDEFVEAEYLVV